jgi:predicted DNA repair protein MutK
MNDRAVAYPILVFFAIALVVFSLVWGLLDSPVQLLFNVGVNQTEANSSARTGLTYARQGWRFMPFFATLISAIGLVATALYLRRGTP